jgi:hypothetical protein
MQPTNGRCHALETIARHNARVHPSTDPTLLVLNIFENIYQRFDSTFASFSQLLFLL